MYIRDIILLLSTEWVDYVEEPMKYQALRPHFFSMVGGRRVLGVGGGVVGPHDTPHHGGHQMPPMLFFNNLVITLPNCQKITWGHHGGHLTPPCYFLAIW